MATPAIYADALIGAVGIADPDSLYELFRNTLFVGGPSMARRADVSPTEALLPLLFQGDARRIQGALLRCSGYLTSPWLEIATNQLTVAAKLARIPPFGSAGRFLVAVDVDVILPQSATSIRQVVLEAWEAMNALITAFLRHFASLSNGRWITSTLVMLLSNYRTLSALADHVEAMSRIPVAANTQRTPNRHMEECARQLNKAFSACMSDRTTEEEHSRRWATYEIVGLVFRVYFKLRSLDLCRNIIRALGAADLPALDRFPRAQRITFRYYTGVLAFLNEDYSKAEVDLQYAFDNCHVDHLHNQSMILRYLIPCRLLRGTLPSPALLRRCPQPASLYAPFIDAIRRGDVRAYDTNLAQQDLEKALVRAGTYLAVERAREICLRGLLVRVYRCRDKASRIALADFHTALRFVGCSLQPLETEWLVASQIAKGYVRGYLSHTHAMAVLSAQNPFPDLGTIAIV